MASPWIPWLHPLLFPGQYITSIFSCYVDFKITFTESSLYSAYLSKNFNMNYLYLHSISNEVGNNISHKL